MAGPRAMARTQDTASLTNVTVAGGSLWWTTVVGMIVIPLAFDPLVKDTFRAPKELVFRAMAIVFLIAFAFRLAKDESVPSFGRYRPSASAMLGTLIVLWTLITAATSTNRLLSFDSLITVVCSVVIFFGMRFALSNVRTPIALDLAFAPAALTAILGSLQESRIWQPIRFDASLRKHMATTALLGNPNDIGMYLLIPALAAALAAIFYKKRRLLYGAVAVLLVAGIAASGSRVVVATYAIGVVVALISHRKGRLLAVVLLATLIAASLAPSGDVANRTRRVVKALGDRRYDIMFSERLPAFLSAIQMARDHPIAGVGPGCFRFHYMRYKTALARQYPAEWTRGWPMNFEQTHNDHLQVIAESGVPGYLLMGAAFVVIARRRLRTGTDSTDRSRLMGSRLRWPLAVALFFVMLAQFPLQLAATRLEILYFAALCTAWDDETE